MCKIERNDIGCYDYKVQEEKGGPYKASIPLIQASNPEADVLLAYEMNGEVSHSSL